VSDPVDERAVRVEQQERLALVAEHDDAVGTAGRQADGEIGAVDACLDHPDQRRAKGRDSRLVVDSETAGSAVRLGVGRGQQRGEGDGRGQRPPH
jgi:hypothetical protein